MTATSGVGHRTEPQCSGNTTGSPLRSARVKARLEDFLNTQLFESRNTGRPFGLQTEPSLFSNQRERRAPCVGSEDATDVRCLTLQNILFCGGRRLAVSSEPPPDGTSGLKFKSMWPLYQLQIRGCGGPLTEVLWSLTAPQPSSEDPLPPRLRGCRMIGRAVFSSSSSSILGRYVLRRLALANEPRVGSTPCVILTEQKNSPAIKPNRRITDKS
ncbi:hypothetical protein NHX12_006377 [Muraenolepis orangiensis]|uniref:Uncharacterized protein n=1 Tax=Muraenolepis orangiensis TaxID=630683 RepID=A0A9Q0DSF9_9TELE|nr:hypothetical protein NHX12_006377 [Muraenolepis orangiensis]